jgi:tRNA A37 threonylcarbamoyladenosine modification protein TsaB
MPAIDRLFRRLGLTPESLRGGPVAVSIGPGGFTGLRIAVSTAKMLAETLGVKIIAVPSALVAAESTIGSQRPEVGGQRSADSTLHEANAEATKRPNAETDGDQRSEASGQRSAARTRDSQPAPIVNRQSSVVNPRQILVALASKGDSFWCTRLARSDDDWSIVGGPPGLAQGESVDLAGAALVLCDAYAPEALKLRCRQQNIEMVEPVFDAGACLVIGERMLARGAVTDPLLLLPLYPREPEAVSLWEKRRLSKAAAHAGEGSNKVDVK